MPIKILIQAAEPEVRALFEELLEPYLHQVVSSANVDETTALARARGPFDVVLVLDAGRSSAELRSRLREVAPDTRVMEFPSLLPQSGSTSARLDSPGMIVEAAEMMELVESVLAVAERGARTPVITVEALREALLETMLTFSVLLEQYEFVNGGNGRPVMEYAVRVASELGLSPLHADEVGFAAVLQDIGMLRGKTAARGRARSGEEDSQRVREHPIKSANLIQRMKLPWRIRHIVVAHHERYDGLGYPAGLRGREIPLGARVLAVVNAFFSMISNRPTRAALPKADAFEELRRLAGRNFDPEVVEIFLALMKDKAYHDPARPARKVLLVSADADFSSLVATKFTDSGFETTSLKRGGEALAYARAWLPDAILLDVDLEDMPGFQLLHWLKQDERLTRVQTLVVAGEPTDTTHAFMAHDMGADDFLLKPVRPSELVARVNAVLRRRDRVARSEFSQIHEGEGLRGNLDELSVPDLVTMLHDGRKTATVSLLGAQGKAMLAFDDGVLVHALAGAIEGESAFRQIYLWRTGDFVIEHGASTAMRSVRRRMDLLVAEASDARTRMLEEERLHAIPVPSATGVSTNLIARPSAVTITSPIPAAVRNSGAHARPSRDAAAKAAPSGEIAAPERTGSKTETRRRNRASGTMPMPRPSASGIARPRAEDREPVGAKRG